jgi:hypothetical protein
MEGSEMSEIKMEKIKITAKDKNTLKDFRLEKPEKIETLVDSGAIKHLVKCLTYDTIDLKRERKKWKGFWILVYDEDCKEVLFKLSAFKYFLTKIMKGLKLC